MSGAAPQLIALDTPALVEASAGTGKTYTIITYFVRAILERDLTPEHFPAPIECSRQRSTT